MKKIVRLLISIELLLISIPIIILLLIKLEIDVYNIRRFISENVLLIIFLFLAITLFSYFLKGIKTNLKVIITILSLVGIIIYYFMYDIMLPF